MALKLQSEPLQLLMCVYIQEIRNPPRSHGNLVFSWPLTLEKNHKKKDFDRKLSQKQHLIIIVEQQCVCVSLWVVFAGSSFPWKTTKEYV